MLNQDFKEFIQSLNENNVCYLVIGGYAVAFHGHPHHTKTIALRIEIHRLGFGAMRITGPRVWGPPLDKAEAIRTLASRPLTAPAIEAGALKALGAGAFGAVWLARDLALGRAQVLAAEPALPDLAALQLDAGAEVLVWVDDAH